ncbi:MAG: hypothetical protein JNL58_24700 [Planctomyces sp.]|nr:hypothetical protein [Planctomyces sp.]
MNRRIACSITILTAVVCGLSGCTSFRTTIVQSTSNGAIIPNAAEEKARGIPVKLKVPSHVIVNIFETFFVQQDVKNGLPSEICMISSVGQRIRSLNLETSVDYTDKVFTVDFRRPAGGLLGISKLEFDSEQYFRKIEAAYEERTLADVDEAIGNIGSAFSSSTTLPKSGEKKLLAFENRLIATQRFDLSEPDWETQMQCFVDLYLQP